VIAECGDPRYYKQRAIELIRTSVDTPFAGDEIQMAISLLALAIVESQLKNNAELLKYVKPIEKPSHVPPKSNRPDCGGGMDRGPDYPVTCGGQGLEDIDDLVACRKDPDYVENMSRQGGMH
jgi:hypothetical protein